MSNDRQDTTRQGTTTGNRDPRLDLKPAELHPPPPGAPVDFRERLARALRTSDPAVLRDAEAAYRGVYDSEHAYVVEQVAAHLQPPDMTWLLACCDPDRLRDGYEGRALVVWSIALDGGGCMVFESGRESPDELRVVLAVELDDDDDAREAPCPRCGATDWTHFAHAGDPDLTPLGCDRCR